MAGHMAPKQSSGTTVIFVVELRAVNVHITAQAADPFPSFDAHILHSLLFTYASVLCNGTSCEKTDFGGFELGVRVLQYVRSPALCKNCVN